MAATSAAPPSTGRSTPSSTLQLTQTGTSNLVALESTLKGPITLGSSNIIHPRSRIVSEGGGEIIIGDNNIIEEGVEIVNWGGGVLRIGNGNWFQTAS
ncbi:hypothetical protein HDV05_000790, partial [Chytridiales sp. JEL 0842]